LDDTEAEPGMRDDWPRKDQSLAGGESHRPRCHIPKTEKQRLKNDWEIERKNVGKN